MIAPRPAPQDISRQRQHALRQLLSDPIAIATCDPHGDLPEPFAEESACLSPNAVEKRRREFAAGRASAHQAMRALDQPCAPILIGPKRAPLWPEGLTGSITHCASCAMAAVGFTRDFTGIGVDVEEDTPLSRDLWDSIASPAEQTWIAAQPDPGQAGKLLFSAKEAAYKAQYSRSERFFGFSGLELVFDTNKGQFTACFTSDQLPYRSGDLLRGRFAITTGVIITAVEISTSELCP
ncbi:4'-phosphopantetheinyl transferase family protein [Tritonibacter mobilis]|uniref:4'-phosphopantetheinyl transferase family protein n=1 Tax=Tritonibacter mobilis TaxID=379347 RepID=UPI003A5B9C4A